MKKENTLQEVQEQISELQQEREKCDVKLKQLQNQGKKLEKLANEKERKRRNHRLIQRGLIVERVIKNPIMFTNDEIEELLKVATLSLFHLPYLSHLSFLHRLVCILLCE